MARGLDRSVIAFGVLLRCSAALSAPGYPTPTIDAGGPRRLDARATNAPFPWNKAIGRVDIDTTDTAAATSLGVNDAAKRQD